MNEKWDRPDRAETIDTLAVDDYFGSLRWLGGTGNGVS